LAQIKTWSCARLSADARYNLLRQTPFGGCCQWVLDDVCKTFEWLSAITVRLRRPPQSLDEVLDNVIWRAMIEPADIVQHQISSAPTSYRGRSIFGTLAILMGVFGALDSTGMTVCGDLNLLWDNSLRDFRRHLSLKSWMLVFLPDVFIQRLLDLFLSDVADDLLLHLAALEYQQSGDAANSISHRRGVVAVHVHLADL
jgi:hypothetical protein